MSTSCRIARQPDRDAFSIEWNDADNIGDPAFESCWELNGVEMRLLLEQIVSDAGLARMLRQLLEPSSPFPIGLEDRLMEAIAMLNETSAVHELQSRHTEAVADILTDLHRTAVT